VSTRTRPRLLAYPKPSVKSLHALLTGNRAVHAQKYDFVWTATSTGWATDGKLLVRLDGEHFRQWKALPDRQCHPLYGKLTAGKKLAPYQDLLKKAKKWKLAHPAEPKAALEWDDSLRQVICELVDAKKGAAKLTALQYALVCHLHPGCRWYVPRLEGPETIVAAVGQDVVALVAALNW
jgi:hypothetical protein